MPPDELLGRLSAGKVYMPQQIERAAGNFFQKGNLIALRELALRQTADRVEDDVQAYRTDQAIHRIWKTEASLLCCVGPDPGGEHVVRSAARLANQLAVEWTAVYVETPKLQRLPPSERERILTTVKLAQDLGAKTAILSGNDAAASIVEYAHIHNCSKLVVGRAHAKTVWAWGGGDLARRLGALAPDVDVIEIGRGEARAEPSKPGIASETGDDPRRASKRLRYLWALLACLATILIAAPMQPYFDLANTVMLFLLAVVLVAVKFGRGPAVLAALVSVASFDFFFVPPRFSFAVSDVQYLLTLMVMLAVALITGQMTAGGFVTRRVSPRSAKNAPQRSTSSRGISPAFSRPSKWWRLPTSSSPEHSRRALRSSYRTIRIGSNCTIQEASRSRLTCAPRLNGHTTSRSRRARGRTRCPEANFCTCRCAHRCARAACSPSRRRIGGSSWCRNNDGTWTRSRRWSRLRSNASTTWRWRKPRSSGWNRSACATPSWQHFRTV